MPQEPAGNEVEEESVYEEDTYMQSWQAEDLCADAHYPAQLCCGAFDNEDSNVNGRFSAMKDCEIL